MPEDNRRTWLAPEDLVRSLRSENELSNARRIPRGRTLYSQGELSTKFYLIVSGLLKISIFREDGTEVILEFMGAGTICGEGAAFDRQPRFSSALAIEETEVIEFDVANWHKNELSTDFLMSVLQVTAIKQRVLANRFQQLFSRQPENRILETFERLADALSDRPSDGFYMLPQLTHENIAAMTGMTRVTVTRALNRLRKSGHIYWEDGRLYLRIDRP